MASTVTKLDHRRRPQPVRRHNWTRAEALGALRPAVHGPAVPRPNRASPELRCQRRADEPPAFDQDRRLRRRLRLLQPVGAPRVRPQSVQADGSPARHRGSQERPRPPARRATAWAPPGAARKRATWMRSSPWSKASRALGMETCMTLGMLSDDDIVAAERCRSRLLQSQRRYVGSLLFQSHHHAHLCRPPRYAGARARSPA